MNRGGISRLRLRWSEITLVRVEGTGGIGGYVVVEVGYSGEELAVVV